MLMRKAEIFLSSPSLVSQTISEGYFDWTGFNNAVSNYPGDDLTLNKHERATINLQDQEVKLLADKLAKFLHDALYPGIDVSKPAAILLNTLTNLKDERLNGYLKFSKDSDGHSSSWEYRVLISVPFGEQVSYLSSSVVTFKITADIEDEDG
ncbi:hypothetical protein AX16_006377 [Volvariella volvacea WC 439]|nr:hypothetical protein AX16_006377 [Volvariella volvacea WC 439]